MCKLIDTHSRTHTHIHTHRWNTSMTKSTESNRIEHKITIKRLLFHLLLPYAAFTPRTSESLILVPADFADYTSVSLFFLCFVLLSTFAYLCYCCWYLHQKLIVIANFFLSFFLFSYICHSHYHYSHYRICAFSFYLHTIQLLCLFLDLLSFNM